MSNQHSASPLYEKSPRAKTSSGSWSIILSTVTSASSLQSKSPTAAILKIELSSLLLKSFF
jgi:hypothetical protein